VRRARSLAAAAALAAALCGGCDRMPGRPKPGAAEVRPDMVKDFGLLYAENCAGCHGAGGRGGAGAIGLANPVYLAIADDAAIRRATAAGVAATLMPPFAQSAGGMLTDEQVEILVRGIRGWARPATPGVAAPPPYAGAGGDAARGGAVFARFCSSCHGENGSGGGKAGSVVDGSFLGLVSDQSLRTTIIAGRPDIGQPDWQNDVAGQPLSAQDVSDVVAWLAAQRPSTPGQPYPGRNP
jgi:cytochrome c oxidase cbb3-type subunit III